ncbi:MAG: aminotransferase class V-fold PLP-dependent enzyme [Gemmatimonadota bacterium]
MNALAAQRDCFSLPDGVHYFNCAYLSPLSKAVEEAGVRAMRRRRAPIDFPADAFYRDSDRVRERFARLLGSRDPSRVAILPSVSYGVAIAARNLSAGPGRAIVVLGEQFPSNLYAWRKLAARTGATLRSVARPATGPPSGRAWNARILEAIDRDTAIVALPHVHWTDGTRFDLEAVGARARECGAALVVDGSQSVGALPFDVETVRPDALICAGYKWLLGPYSVALGWLGPRFDEGEPLEETWIARRGSEDFRRLIDYVDEYAPGAVRYDVGERSNFLLLPMMIAALDQLLEWRPARIQAYCRSLLAPLADGLRERGLEVEPEEGRAAHILGVRLPQTAAPAEVATRLERARVYASLRGDALRVSPNVYNLAEDVEALDEALRSL